MFEKFQLNQATDRKNGNKNCLNELNFVRFHKILFKQMLKVSAFYLKKRKILFLKKYNEAVVSK